MSSRSLDHRSTEIEDQAHQEAALRFADQLTQFPLSRDRVSRLESDIAKLALAAMAASSKPPHGDPVLADDSCLWHKSVELFDDVFVCHRQTGKEMEFAVIERFPSGTSEIWMKGRNAVEVLKIFTEDQRHALEVWTEDVTVQLKRFLAEKYPGHDMTRVAESFLDRFTQAKLRNQLELENREVRIKRILSNS